MNEDNKNWVKVDSYKNPLPVDEQTGEILEHTGIELNKEALKDVSRESIMDFIEANNIGSLDEETIDKMVEEMQETLTVPEVVEKADEINKELGLRPEDLKQLYSYISGKGDKPLFLDKYLADSENKLKDFHHIMTLIRLGTIPQLAAMQIKIQQALYSPERLIGMDTKDLSQASANLSREMSDILNSATKSIELMNSMGRVDSRYRSMMDKLLVVPENVLVQIEHLLSNYQ